MEKSITGEGDKKEEGGGEGSGAMSKVGGGGEEREGEVARKIDLRTERERAARRLE